MSSLTVYSTEPATKGKVVLHTNIGPLDIELWSKEAPLACRNFVQLCLENYYDGCLFHRCIKDFMAQTGDPTGTGKGGSSVYPGGQFKDEFHSRLRFTHRGLLGMASTGPDTNGSQFFITLDRCEWLDRKHTIFGKVTGNSLYNLNRFNELEVDSNDRPEFPPRIERTEVLLEPFDDIVPRQPAAVAPAAAGQPAAKKRKKEKKNINLLSFGEEAAADEAEGEALPSGKAAKGGLSSHDLLDQPRLSKRRAIEDAAEDGGKAGAPPPPPAARHAEDPAAADAAFEQQMLARMQAKRERLQAASAGAAAASEADGGGGGRAKEAPPAAAEEQDVRSE